MSMYTQDAAAGTSGRRTSSSARASNFGALHPDERVGQPLKDRASLSLPWGGILAVISVSAGLIVFESGLDRRAETLLEPAFVHHGGMKPAPENVGRTERPTAHAAAPDTPGDPDVPRHEEPRAPVVAELAAYPYETSPPEPAPRQREAAHGAQTAHAQQKPRSTDPIQQRAVAAGLHPELSRVLLRQLSPADLRNAGVAIKTALSETAHDAVFLWPREARADLARFRVRFVTGATPGCRRYIVEVIKDRWVTTALPVEKCGLSGPLASRE
jgi:hypothetical protein